MSEEKTVVLKLVYVVCVPVRRPASLCALFVTESRFVLYMESAGKCMPETDT